MRSTRKKVIKTVYKNDDSEDEGGDFTDSGSDAKISEGYNSDDDDDEVVSEYSSADEFQKTSVNQVSKRKCAPRKTQTKLLVKKITKQINNEEENVPHFSIKDLTEADKLLPPILNLSESDSSDDESPKASSENNSTQAQHSRIQHSEQNDDSDMDVSTEYKDVWSHNVQVPDNSEEIAKKTFMELEQHKSNVEETKAALQNYQLKTKQNDSDVKDLLAMGEEQVTEVKNVIKKHKFKKRKDDSDSELEDWEEVKETKEIPQQGIQLFVEFPDGGGRKSKKIDVEMMMKRKINRVKKEYQVYMHKVHVLCWLGHGNYISRVLNDQELMAAALSLVPSKECYPSVRVDMKYVEQITTWYKDKLTIKPDKNEDKFKPKAPPLKTILLDLIKKRIVTSKKYLVFIFISMLRALGLQCRVMFNFVTLPLKPPHSELCSLSTKPKDTNKQKTNVVKSQKTGANTSKNENDIGPKASTSKEKSRELKIPQLDGTYDSYSEDEEMLVCNETQIYSAFENIMQVDGNDDTINTRSTRSKRTKANVTKELEEEDVSPPKMAKKSAGRNVSKPTASSDSKVTNVENRRSQRGKKVIDVKDNSDQLTKAKNIKIPNKTTKSEKDLAENNKVQKDNKSKASVNKIKKPVKKNPKADEGNEIELNAPKINVVDENNKLVSSKFFEESKSVSRLSLSRKRSQTENPGPANSDNKLEEKNINKTKSRTKSAPGTAVEKSKYFNDTKIKENNLKKLIRISKTIEDKLRVSHKDLIKSITTKKKNDITGDLVNIVKNRIKDAKTNAKKGKVKGKIKEESDDSDYLPIEDSKRRDSDSGEEFKPTKITPKATKSGRRIDRRVISTSTEEGVNPKKTDVWCEIFVEELEQWISVDVIKGKIHSTGDLYTNATHPVCYIVGWDNNNYLKDLTRKYVPQYNTVTRKIRAETSWWNKAISPYLGPKTARDLEEDEYLDRMQLEAPLPKSIAEYKNHPLYALKRHLLKYEAIYPPDAATLGFVRNEPVYARECVYVCRSRDTWLKEAKVVRLGEKPYKIVKARPKWDKLSNKLITDKPLEVFGPWQVQEYEPPVAENGIVPRNAYGNVELFKECMLPKGTVHLKLPSLNRVARKLNIDCAPAMTGFDFNGGWSHPVYDGFVVCQEFAEIVTDAWVKDQEEQERREREKTELRVYGNWKKLIKGLLIRERLKHKYGFEEPTTASASKGKSKAPRLVVKKK